MKPLLADARGTTAGPSGRTVVAGVAVTAAAAGLAGLALGSGSRTGAVLAVAPAVGLGLVALAAARFELFIAVILLVRSSLDAVKLGGPAWMDPAALLSGLLVVAGVLWLAVQSNEGPAPASTLVRPLAALAAAASVSVAFAPDPLQAAFDVVRLGTVVVIVMILNRLLTDPRAVRIILSAVFLSALVPLARAGYQLATDTGFRMAGGFTRIIGTFVHPNPFAIYLTMVIVLGVALLPHLRARMRLPLIALLIACGVFLLLTYTRSAWLGALAGLATVALLQSKRLLLVVGGFVLIVALLVPSAAARFDDLQQRTRPSGAPANSLVWRFEYWRRAMHVSTNPVFGIGLGSVQEVTDVGKEPHNDFVRVYVETGVVGLLAYLWLLWSLYRVARGAVRTAPPGLDRGVAVGFAAAFVSILIVSIVSNVLTQLVILWYFATLAAAADAVWWRARERAASSPVLSP